MKRGLVLSIILLMFCRIVIGQISITSLPYTPATTDFNSYNPTSAGTLLSTIPTGWTATNSGTTWYRGQGNGTSTLEGYWALGTGGDYCLGSVPSGTTDNITYTVSFVNNSGSTITTLTISWDYEQWHYSGASDLLVTGTGALAANATLNAQDYNGGGGTDGTVTTTSISIVLTGLSIGNGTAFGITWVAANTGSSASDNGIGIDNFLIAAGRTNKSDYFRSKQSGNWSSPSTWESSTDGISWSNSNLAPDNIANTITILNGHTVTLTSSVSVDQSTINNGGQVSVSSGQTLTVANGTGTDLTVNGTLSNSGTITPTGIIDVSATGIYQHAQDGGTVPTATWNIASNCNITGITNTAPSGLIQTFGNFSWDCANHSALINLNSTLTTINGNFNVKNAGDAAGKSGISHRPLVLSANTNLILNIGGNFNVTQDNAASTSWVVMSNGTANVTVNVTGNFNMSNNGAGSSCYFDFKEGTGTSKGTHIMNVTGDFTITGGEFNWSFEASGGSNQTLLNLSGNFSVTGASTLIDMASSPKIPTTIPNGKIYFVKAGTQTAYAAFPANITNTNFQVKSGSRLNLSSNFYLSSSGTAVWAGQFVVDAGGKLDMSTYQLLSTVSPGTNNVFTLNSTAYIITANANGLENGTTGSVSSDIATRTYNSSADYEFQGAATGSFTTTPTANTVRNMYVNRTAGVTQNMAIAVSTSLNFTDGILTTTTTNLMTINDNAVINGAVTTVSSNAYVSGPLKKIGNDAFSFPVGKTSHGCRPISISAPSNITDAFRAELIRGDAGALGSITALGLARVSGCEYWYLDRLVGSSNVNVTLSWSGESPCNAMSYVTDLPNLTVAHFNGTNWDSHNNNGGYTGNAVSGTVTWNTVSTFSPFSLGSLFWWLNPLTVKYIDLKTSEKNGQVKVDWINTSESGVKEYFIEYSTDGKNFSEAGRLSAKLNNKEKAGYNWWHLTPSNGKNYYRIKTVEFTGEISYSSIALVNLDKSFNGIVIYPNPVKGKQFSISASGLADGRYDIFINNVNGQKVMQSALIANGGTISIQLTLPEGLTPGVYSLQLTGREQKLIKSILVQ